MYHNSDSSRVPKHFHENAVFFILQESIGQRTRSKLSLSDTPLEMIENAFVPPDITTDMYDSECDDDNWKDFLKNFTEPLSKPYCSLHSDKMLSFEMSSNCICAASNCKGHGASI
jgi:hypothetical protein